MKRAINLHSLRAIYARANLLVDYVTYAELAGQPSVSALVAAQMARRWETAARCNSAAVFAEMRACRGYVNRAQRLMRA